METLRQIYWLLGRQWYLVKNSIPSFCLNYLVLWPFIFSFSQGYLNPSSFFGAQAADKGTELVIGMLFLQVFVVAFFMAVEAVKEREPEGVFGFHVVATSYFAAFVSRIIFYTLYTYVAIAPFMLSSKLILGTRLYTDLVIWSDYFMVLLLVAIFVVAYIFFVLTFIRSMRSIEHMWAFGVEPVLWLGGMWAPLYAIAKSNVPGITWVTRYNPFGYATDALRQIFFHDARFAPLALSCSIMAGATVLFLLLSYFLLKRRLRVVG